MCQQVPSPTCGVCGAASKACKCRTCDNCGQPFVAAFWWQCCCDVACYAAYLGVDEDVAGIMFEDSASVEG